jgi:hypothetical protein
MYRIHTDGFTHGNTPLGSLGVNSLNESFPEQAVPFPKPVLIWLLAVREGDRLVVFWVQHRKREC